MLCHENVRFHRSFQQSRRLRAAGEQFGQNELSFKDVQLVPLACISPRRMNRIGGGSAERSTRSL
jgi:hypothetical protein